MMNDFFNIFSNELKATIEGLTGRAPEVGERNEFDAPTQNGIKPPVVMANISLSGDINAKTEIVCTPVLISAISEWMMGEEEISKSLTLQKRYFQTFLVLLVHLWALKRVCQR